MPNRHEDWLKQAKRDLNHARNAFEDGEYEWACFAAQQSAEKAVKALLMHSQRDAWGHSVAALLQQLPPHVYVDDDVLDMGRELDRHYISPRYPNSYPQGAPYEFYTRAEAERAIGHTQDILAICDRLLAESGAGAGELTGGGGEAGPETSGD